MVVLWAAGISFAVFAAGSIFSWNKYVEMYQKDFHQFFDYVALFIVTLLYFVRFAIAGIHEMNMLGTYFDESSIPRIKPRIYYAAIFTGIFFGISIAIAHLIIFYSALLIVHNLLDIWGIWEVRQIVDRLVQQKLSQHLSNEDRNIIITIQDYYKKPNFERVATSMSRIWNC
jgi:hypothetical protein